MKEIGKMINLMAKEFTKIKIYIKEIGLMVKKKDLV